MASFPVKPGEQIMLATDQGKMIRTTIGSIRIAGRNTQGVMIFRVDQSEHVVSVARIDEDDEAEVEAMNDGEVAHDDGADTASRNSTSRSIRASRRRDEGRPGKGRDATLDGVRPFSFL